MKGVAHNELYLFSTIKLTRCVSADRGKTSSFFFFPLFKEVYCREINPFKGLEDQLLAYSTTINIYYYS